MKVNNQDSLAKAGKQICMALPFYGLYLMMLNKRWDKRVPTAGVSKNGISYQLTINEDFWEGLTPLYQQGVLTHEILHISFFHLERWDEFENKDVANLAMDISINQYVPEDWLPEFKLSKQEFNDKYDPIIEKLTEQLNLDIITHEEYKKQMHKIPPRGVYIKDFPEMNLELKQGTRYYYDKFMEGQKQKQQSSGRGEDSKGSGGDGKGKGTSGSASLDDLLEQIEQGKATGYEHDWKEFQNMSEAEKKLLKSQTDFHLKEIAAQITKSRGTIPSELKEYIDQIDQKEPPKFDWKGYLRRFTGGSTKIYTKKLHRKYNKRFEDSPGLKIKKRKHILCAVDTSGSVSRDELKEFFHEIYHIHKNGTEVTVLQCDAAISNISPYRKGHEDKIKVFGRGGTSFEPIISHANENANKYTGLLIFTDGEAPAPEKCKIRTLWIHSSKSTINESLIGHKIKLN